MVHYPNAIGEKARQGGDLLFSFVAAVIAACAGAIFIDPIAEKQLGSEIPWWIYLLLFGRFVASVVHAWTDDTSLQIADPRPAAGRTGRDEAGDFEGSGWGGVGSPDFVTSEIHS